MAPALDTGPLEKVFKHTILKILLRKGKITEEVVKRILPWRHSGFDVHCNRGIQSGDEAAIENLARYIVRASFSQDRMTWIPDESKGVYRAKDGKDEKTSASFPEKPNTMQLLAFGVVGGLAGLRKKYRKS